MTKPARPRGEQFAINVLWSWTGVAANLFVGFIITPFIIRRLGAEQYGIWGLIFSILDYFWFFDLGLNTAVCNFCARFIAVKDHEKINQVISTALFYFSIIALTVWAITPFAAIVTRSSAAEMSATGRREDALKLGIYSNRYSLTLFMPLVVFLSVYGTALILRWVGPEMAEHSAPLLPVPVVGARYRP